MSEEESRRWAFQRQIDHLREHLVRLKADNIDLARKVEALGAAYQPNPRAIAAYRAGANDALEMIKRLGREEVERLRRDEGEELGPAANALSFWIGRGLDMSGFDYALQLMRENNCDWRVVMGEDE